MGSRAIAATALATALAVAVGCSPGNGGTVASSSVPPEDIPPCTEVYTEGKTIKGNEFGQACVTAAGGLLTPLPIRIDCNDDRRLLWNDLAWGYLNGPMQMTDEEQTVKIPEAELTECLSGDPDDTTTTA
jgi:hypothetical protein